MRTDLVGVFEFEAGDDLTLQLAVGRRLVQDGLTELGDVGFTGLPQHRVQPEVCAHTHKLSAVALFLRLFQHAKSVNVLMKMASGRVSACTCVLGDLSLGDHLFAFRIHQLAVLVLFQTLKNVLSLGLRTEPLKHTFT